MDKEINTYILMDKYITCNDDFSCSNPKQKAYLYDKDKNFIKEGLLLDFINSNESEIPLGSFMRINFASAEYKEVNK